MTGVYKEQGGKAAAKPLLSLSLSSKGEMSFRTQ